MARRTLAITYVATYLLAFGGVIRTLVQFRDDRFPSLVILFGAYLLLLLAEPSLIRRNRPLTYIYLVAQTAIICTLALVTPEVDFWAVLFCPLVVQTMHNFPRRIGFLITGLFILCISVFMPFGLTPDVSLPLILTYLVIYFLVASFIAIIREAQAANQALRGQQLELEAAHEQLRSYTARAEELAVVEERNRLARELHDSVTQSLYSLTLLAVAGERMIQAGDMQQIEGNQLRLGEIAQQALQEMRLLVYELRPAALASEGLIGALEHRLESVERRAGLQARMSAEGTFDLSPSVEEELYRIAQEALNNALKHSRAKQVVLSVRASDGLVTLEVGDDGQGFDLAEIDENGGLGLVSMRERAENVGGHLTIRSAPGEGTRVTVVVPLGPGQSLANGHSPVSLEAVDG